MAEKHHSKRALISTPGIGWKRSGGLGCRVSSHGSRDEGESRLKRETEIRFEPGHPGVTIVGEYETLTLALFVCGPLISQQAEFDVASIRPAGNAIAKPAMEFTPGGGVRATNVTLKMLIQMAYDIRDDQISGGPGWTDSETYTVVAKGSGGGTAASKTALQALLRERFHLDLKQETNAAAGYVMAVGKSEPKITLDTGRERPLMRQTGRWSLHCERVAMSSLARFLSVHLGRSVEDRTGMEGRYNFELNWRPADLSE